MLLLEGSDPTELVYSAPATSECIPHAQQQAVDKDTLLQLRGCTAKGFAFDRRFGVDQSSDDIYENCVAGLVENLFKVGACLMRRFLGCVTIGASSGRQAEECGY